MMDKAEQREQASGKSRAESGFSSALGERLSTGRGFEGLRAKLSNEQLAALENQRKLHLVTQAGVAITRERDIVNILEVTLHTARKLTNADAGSIYMLHEEFADDPVDPARIEHRELRFVALQNETMDTYLVGEEIELMPPVPLAIDGEPNLANVSAYCVNKGVLLSFDDVYAAEGFAFEGTQAYDEANDYRSQSMLVIPLEDHEDNVIGVLQLINRRDRHGEVIGFSRNDVELVQSVSYPAAASITAQRLIQEQATLFNAFVNVLAQGLGEKSPHTYNHIRRVTALGESISETLSQWQDGMYAGVQFSAEEIEEIRLAGWLHDIGKMTTPEHIVSKQVKLQFVMDRFELVVERFNSRLKDTRIAMLEAQLDATRRGADAGELDAIAATYAAEVEKLEAKLNTLFAANRGGESVSDEVSDLVEELSLMDVAREFSTAVSINHGYPLVTAVERAKQPGRVVDAWEKENLLVGRGTLNQREREAINLHADRSWRWLMSLPFPRKQKRLPLYAGAHHEHLNGSGHPNGLAAEQMPLQSRILAIADIYEALVAPDRPYKGPMKLSEALAILGTMVREGKLDGEIMRVFLYSGCYLRYAEEFLDAEQIDAVDIDVWMADYYVAPVPPVVD